MTIMNGIPPTDLHCATFTAEATAPLLEIPLLSYLMLALLSFFPQQIKDFKVVSVLMRSCRIHPEGEKYHVKR